MSAKRGRPKGATGINLNFVLTTSLEMLEENGFQRFSMRSLAEQLDITPMAIYHYFPNRSALMKELFDVVYAQVTRDFESVNGDPRSKIKQLLIMYYQTGLRYPNLTIAIFSTPEAFSAEAKRVTFYITELLQMTKLTPKRKQMWLEILVDFTHGSSLATALVGRSHTRLAKKQRLAYDHQIDELLDQIF